MWLERNQRVFNDRCESVEEIWDHIKYTVALWSLTLISLKDFLFWILLGVGFLPYNGL